MICILYGRHCLVYVDYYCMIILKRGGVMSQSCLVNIPCIVLVPLFELAVMFSTGDNRDILIIGLSLESIVLNMIL